MSFFDSITKRSKLKTAIKLTADARKQQGEIADQLFHNAYQDYAEAITNQPLVAEALYNWGFALLHQAKTKSVEAAIKLYEDAISKFSFCLLVEPAYLGAAIDGGVAYMELARIKALKPTDDLYEEASNFFKRANAIQAGSASYNLACIYGLRGDKEACLTALEISKNKGSLPDPADILGDPDMFSIKHLPWFAEFMDTVYQELATAEANKSNRQQAVAKLANPELAKAEALTETSSPSSAIESAKLEETGSSAIIDTDADNRNMEETANQSEDELTVEQPVDEQSTNNSHIS